MSENLLLLRRKLDHLERMRQHLEYSLGKVREPLAKIARGAVPSLTPEEHETITAFGARFADFQEHIAKAMRGIAIEEEINVERFGSVLAFMQKMEVLGDAELWKAVRELRNSVNHVYEDDPDALFQLLDNLVKNVPFLIATHDNLKDFVRRTYAPESGEG